MRSLVATTWIALLTAAPLQLAAQVLVGDRVQSAAGARVEVGLTLRSEGQAVSALQFELPFSAVYTIAATANRPACRVAPEIDKPGSIFAFVPADCDPQASCEGVRAILFEFGEQFPIPDGARVASCTLQVRPEAPPGAVPIEIRGVVASSPLGERLPAARAENGELEVLPSESPTAPPSASPSPSPSPTAPPSCAGDCNGDDTVTIDELLLLVLDALQGSVERCVAGDRNGDGSVTIDEIIGAVARALEGCP